MNNAVNEIFPDSKNPMLIGCRPTFILVVNHLNAEVEIALRITCAQHFHVVLKKNNYIFLSLRANNGTSDASSCDSLFFNFYNAPLSWNQIHEEITTRVESRVKTAELTRSRALHQLFAQTLEK